MKSKKIYCKSRVKFVKERNNLFNKFGSYLGRLFDEFLEIDFPRYVRIILGLPIFIIYAIISVILYPLSFHKKIVFESGKWYEYIDFGDGIYVIKDSIQYSFSAGKRKWYNILDENCYTDKHFIKSNIELRKLKLKKLNK